MRPIKHLTPRYIFNKISRLIDERINPDNPWLTPESVKILNSIIKMMMLELSLVQGEVQNGS